MPVQRIHSCLDCALCHLFSRALTVMILPPCIPDPCLGKGDVLRPYSQDIMLGNVKANMSFLRLSSSESPIHLLSFFLRGHHDLIAMRRMWRGNSLDRHWCVYGKTTKSMRHRGEQVPCISATRQKHNAKDPCCLDLGMELVGISVCMKNIRIHPRLEYPKVFFCPIYCKGPFLFSVSSIHRIFAWEYSLCGL